MKKYIKAAYDTSIPSWLKDVAHYNHEARQYLRAVYSMASAKFYNEPQPNSVEIMLLYDVYEARYRGEKEKYAIKEWVYVPERPYTGEDVFIKSGNTFRRVNVSARAKLMPHVADIVYMVAPKRDESRKDRTYVDPRYQFESGRTSWKWEYKGQKPSYAWDTKGKENKNVVDHWFIPSSGWSVKRDKSGYVLPTPETLYEKLYKRFPEVTQNRIDSVKEVLERYYNLVDEAKNRIFSIYDIRKGKYVPNGSQSPINDLNQAIYYYRRMYEGFNACISDDGKVDTHRLSAYTKGSDGLNYWTNGIDNYLDELYRKLD